MPVHIKEDIYKKFDRIQYEIYSGGKGWSLLATSRCFLIFMYPKTDTMMMNTTKPMQLPTIRPSLLVSTDANPMELLGMMDSLMSPPGSSRVDTEVHLLVGESIICDRIDSLKMSSCCMWKLLSFSDLEAILASGAGPVAGQSPRPKTHIV